MLMLMLLMLLMLLMMLLQARDLRRLRECCNSFFCSLSFAAVLQCWPRCLFSLPIADEALCASTQGYATGHATPGAPLASGLIPQLTDQFMTGGTMGWFTYQNQKDAFFDPANAGEKDRNAQKRSASPHCLSLLCRPTKAASVSPARPRRLHHSALRGTVWRRRGAERAERVLVTLL